MKDKIKSIDIFGHPIQLNFDEKGITHKTILGGICTILYYIFIIGYAAYCFYKLMYHAQDSNSLVNTSLDLAQLGNVNFNETSLVIFSMIKGKHIDGSL